MSQNSMQGVRVTKTEQLPPLPPVVGIRLKKTTAEVIRATAPARGGGRRQKITSYSRSSVNNAIEVLTNADPELNSMIVCTYPETYPNDGRVVKAHHKRMLQAIERKLGDGYSYFTAFEFQQRGAPHFHIGLSIDLKELGEVITLGRKKSIRRKPTFQTVKSFQDWAFTMWVDIISKPDPVHNGQKLDWIGLDGDDIAAMEAAYHHYNAGFSWEVMRDQDGAKKYFVKELAGLKGYQKQIPDDYDNPGRPFLYSLDMRFDDENALEFALTDREIRQFLEQSKWAYLPDDHKPLYKRLWNSADGLAIELIKAGMKPVTGGMEALRQYADVRMRHFTRTSAEYQQATGMADFAQGWASFQNWERIKRRLVYADQWEYIYSTGPP